MTPNQLQAYQFTEALIELGVFVHKYEVVDYLQKLGFFETPKQKKLADKMGSKLIREIPRKCNFKDFLKKVRDLLW